MAKFEVKTHDYPIGRGHGSIGIDKEDGSFSGTVYTPHGIVKVYSQGIKGLMPSTLMEFVFDGKGYTRHLNRYYKSRYLVTLAKAFAKEIHKKCTYPRISYATQVLIAIYDFQNENGRGIGFNELVEYTGLDRAIVSKAFDYHMDHGIIKDDWAVVDGMNCKVIFMTKHTMEDLKERIEQVKMWLE
ncbi:hypothetical protein KAU43_01430 [candidate division WOR-3 bacterium]|nr:hypothetical protein [candidate division WOR-3 bacterium]